MQELETMTGEKIFVKNITDDMTPAKLANLLTVIEGYYKRTTGQYQCAIIEFATNGHFKLNEYGHFWIDKIHEGWLRDERDKITAAFYYQDPIFDFDHVLETLLDKIWVEIIPLIPYIKERFQFEFA